MIRNPVPRLENNKDQPVDPNFKIKSGVSLLIDKFKTDGKKTQ
jgi:hypothetical protein